MARHLRRLAEHAAVHEASEALLLRSQARRELRKAEQAPGAGPISEGEGAPARAALNTLRSVKHRAPRQRPAQSGAAGGVARLKRKGIFGPGSEPGKQSGGVSHILVPARSPLRSLECECCSCHVCLE